MTSSRRVLIVLAALFLVTLGLPWGGLVSTASAQVTVTSADPPTGEQGTLNLSVLIKGKGFKNGAKAKWFKTGTTDPAGVNVKSTQYVSSTQLIATIDIADAAALSLFDIQVANTDGRTGKGTGLFSVVAKKIDPCTAGDPEPTPSAYLSYGPGPSGYLDANFGNGTGRVIGLRGIDIIAVAVQTVGGESRIVGAGRLNDPCLPPSGGASTWVVVRYLQNGALDASFGDGGIVKMAYVGGASAAGVAVDSDNKILALGYASPKKSSGNFPTVVRYNEDGSLDSTFGTAGIVMLTNIASVVPKSLAIQKSDGKILAAGSSANSAMVFRLNRDGTLDSTFNGTGAYQYAGAASWAYAVTTQWVGPDERIVMAGVLFPTGGVRNGALWRLTSSGRPDLDFGASGLVLTTFNGMHTDYDGVAVDGSNRLVAVGYRNSSGELPSQLALARYSESGALDETFGTAGDGKVLLTSPLTCFGNSVAVLADGGILASGWTRAGVDIDYRFAAWRFSTGGELDVTFGEHGTFSDPITGNASAFQHAMALDSDGGIIIGGYLKVHGSTYVPYAVILRLWQ